MCTAPGNTTIVHANLTPIGMPMKNQKLKVYVQMATHPPQHPSHTSITQTAKLLVKSHPTALHQLATLAKFNPTRMEKITPAQDRPGMLLDITINIKTLKEKPSNQTRKDSTKG
jgi:hypothetical protein